MIRNLATCVGAAGMAAGLAACSEPERLSGEEVLAKAGQLENPRPGLYQETKEMVAFEISGADPQQADRLRDQIAGLEAETSQRCITKDSANEGFEPLLKELVEGINKMDCGFTSFETAAPRVNAALTCDGPLDATAGVSFAGTTSTEGYEVNLDLEASSRLLAGGSMEMRMRVESKRIGDCDGGSEGTASK